MPPCIACPGHHTLTGRADPGLRHVDILLLAGFLGIERPGSLVGDVARAINVGDHVRRLVLQGLERRDHAVKLDAFLGVVHGDLEGALAQPDQVGRG
jgi:hypothetical protein